MSWIRFVFLSSLVLFNSVQAVITLSIGNNALIGTPTDINWSRERGDPKSFDLHKFLDGEDYGFIAHIDVPKGKNEGHISVSFDEEGSFTIRAFDFEESQQPLAETPNKVNVQPFAGPPDPSGTDGPDGSPTPTSDPTSSTSTPITTLYSSTVAPAPTSTTPPNTASSSIAPTANSSHTPSSTTKSPPHINAAAIAGGVIGGIVLLALLTLGIILFLRRRRAKQELDRRFSFHRDLMVQARPNALSHSHPHLASEAPSPRLPRFSFQRRREPAAPSAAPLAHSFTPAHAGPTDRQLQLGARVRQLEEMMHDIRYRPGMSRVLEQLRVQVSWLRAQRNTPWALHQTDEKPLHYDLYMTS